MPDARLGVDVGGTFTDFVVFDPESGSFSVGKTLTTPQDLALGIIRGTREAAERAGFEVRDISQVTYGTTLVANLLLERKGVRVGLIATEGFRDVLETGTEQRYDMYDLTARRAEPLVPRNLRRTVRERVGWDGEVLVPLDPSSLDSILSTFEAYGVETIAVALLHSYRNPSHERMVREYLKDRYPQYGVSLSSEVAPEVREYPRTSTTVANAYVEPPLRGHLAEMEDGLRSLGFEGVIYMMLSEGGITTMEAARSFPVRLVESGPAAGAMAAAYYGEALGYGDLLSFDMGGTTAKLCLITGGRPSRTTEFEVAREHRFKKGSGLILKVPAIDMIEIGAGGGSIAYVDPMGLMKVGPQSAGADPGPACYGLGGTEPTVSDADLVLGLLNPDYFLGGEMSLDPDSAQKAIETRLAVPMGMSVTRAAQGIHEVVNENMATAARMHAAEQGLDIRGSALVAFGGAGPVHAYQVAKVLGINRVVCPLGAGVMSSIGMLVAPKSFDSVQSYISRLDSVDWDHVSSIYETMESSAVELLTLAGVEAEDIRIERSADMRYVGQGFEIVVPVPGGKLGPGLQETLAATFSETYKSLFGRILTDVPVETITWRLSASEPPPRPDIRFRTAESPAHAGGVKGERPVFLTEEGRFIDCPVFDRYGLEPGATVNGPAIVEEREATVFVGPDARCAIDEHLNPNPPRDGLGDSP